MTFPADIQSTIRIGIGLDLAPDQSTRHLVLLEHDPLALERKRQLGTDVTLLTFAQDVAQPIGGKIQRLVQVVRSGRGNGKLAVMALHELRQESVTVVHAADALQTQIPDQTVL